MPKLGRLQVRLHAVIVHMSDSFGGIWLARYHLQNSSETCCKDGPVAAIFFRVKDSGVECWNAHNDSGFAMLLGQGP